MRQERIRFAGDANVIAASGLDGVLISGAGARINRVWGNYIGTDAAGSPKLGNSGAGVAIAKGASDNQVGGDRSKRDGNVIEGNAGAGVVVLGTGTGNAIRANAIYANGGLGIDLGGDGVTPNDKLDADEGPNRLQNAPTLLAVTTADGRTTIDGSMQGAPSTRYAIEVFANDAADPSGYGEGEALVRTVVVTTDAGGEAGFTLTLGAADGVSPAYAATATDPGGNTSEFGAALSSGFIGGAGQRQVVALTYPIVLAIGRGTGVFDDEQDALAL